MNAVGVDVGGTKIAAGVVTPEGKILDEVRYPTPHSPRRWSRLSPWRSLKSGTVPRSEGCASPCQA